MNEDGSEHLYYTDVNEPIVNLGVSVLASSPGSLIDPFVLGSKDENDVQGYAGIPTDVNALTYDANFDIGAAGVQFPRLQRFYVAVDSRADPFTNQSQKGKYLLNAWVNDLTPPFVRVLTTKVSAGRPLLVAQAVDLQSGVDPLSLVDQLQQRAHRRLRLRPVHRAGSLRHPDRCAQAEGRHDEDDRVRLGLPGGEEHQHGRRTRSLPNTAFLQTKLTVVDGPTVTWVEPPAHVCALKSDRLVVVAGATKKIKSVTFTDGEQRIGVDKTGPGGVYSVAWNTKGLEEGHAAAPGDRDGRVGPTRPRPGAN